MSTADTPTEDAADEDRGPSITDWPYMPPVLDARSCALLLGMKSRAEILRLAREQRLPSVKFGKRRLFLTDEVIATLRRMQLPAVLDGDFARRGRVDRPTGKEA
ncbi:MAG: hypothetical protein L6R43_01525 [Planctomycetes bacterium]|nr:hypothetical protein [Planctomycetota bacterium]